MDITLNGKEFNFVFNPYKEENELGRGGMSNVFKGRNGNTGEPIAVKVLLNDLSNNPMYVERAKRESSIRLDHPNVIRVFDFIKQGDKYHLITEFLDGYNIEKKIEENNKKGVTYEVEDALKIIKQALSGLNVLHSLPSPVFHRDVKPSNMMYCRGGNVKIMDFGVSKIEKKESSKLTSIGVKIGTIVYSAPEQVRGENNRIDQRTDIYGAGISCYEMLTGKVPFDSPNDFDLQTKIQNNPLPEHKKIPEKVFKILQKATAKKMENRYENVEEFIAAIDTYLDKPETPDPFPIPMPKNLGQISIIITIIILIIFILLTIL